MVVAFIPVRGGSKSIPLKNIKLLCGKPLVCWCIEALVQCDKVDEIVVATDSDEIERVVSERNYDKLKIYRRLPENASDTSSTESVMLEYIHAVNLLPETIFMLVQATSPLTESIHFSEALDMYAKGTFDSVLTCVRNYRFFWNEDGTSMNYDYRNRPRRQNFKGMLMENGAFYVNTVKNILASGNRLSGHIGIYEMPEYTATEIDEPDDWIVMENLMKRRIRQVQNPNLKKSVKLFLCDVDGTLTDAGMYYSEKGDELKKFNTRDGMGFQLLREAGIKTGIITSENTHIVTNRANKLKVDFMCQGQRNGGKLSVALEICNQLGVSLDEVAYMGDDINCLELLSAVGYCACPQDADNQVKRIPNIYIAEKCGGMGCVREFIEKILGRM